MYINILNSLHHHHRTIYFSPLLFKILNFFTSSKCTIIFSLNLTPVIVLLFYTPLCPDKHASSKNIYTHYYHYSDHHIKTVAIYSHIENIFNYPSLIFPQIQFISLVLARHYNNHLLSIQRYTSTYLNSLSNYPASFYIPLLLYSL